MRSSCRGYAALPAGGLKSKEPLKTTLIEPADETFEDSNVFLRLVERRHL
jgi:hypothetical protein